MELDWTTVALEVVNFLVLVWLLKRFFYRPVLEVIEKRRAASEKIVTDAEGLRREGEALKAEYTLRLAEADQEREKALARLDEEIAGQRAKRLEAVEVEVKADRARRQMLEERDRAAQSAALEQQAVAIAGRFASRFLDRLAGPELEGQLVDLALAELSDDTAEKLAALRAVLQAQDVCVRVLTAFPLEPARRQALSAALNQLAGRALNPEFGEDATLKAGLCLSAGSWTLQANLRDELAFFAEAPAND